MAVIQICPKCGLPAIKVGYRTVEFQLNETYRSALGNEAKWSCCVHPDCTVAYFSRKQCFETKDLTGSCKTRNPLGKCCRNVFLKTIADALADGGNQ